MRHFLVIALLSISLRSTFLVSADPLDDKCATLAATNANWNYQIPMNVSLLPESSKYEAVELEDSAAAWLLKTWIATKKNVTLGPIKEGFELVRGFALAESVNSTNPLVVAIHSNVTVHSATPTSATTLSQLCSMAMNMTERSNITVAMFNDMFQPITDEKLIKEIRDHAVSSSFWTSMTFFGILIGVIVLLGVLGAVFFYKKTH